MGNSAPTAHPNSVAGATMLASALLYSFTPLLIVAVHADQYPFTFNTLYRLGAALGSLLFLATFYRTFLLDRRILQLVRKALLTRNLPLLVLPYFGYTAFAWSVRFIHPSVTTLIQEAWPALFIIFTTRLLRAEGRYHKVTPLQMLMVTTSFVGFGAVVHSQGNGIRITTAIDSDIAIGIALALLAAFFISSTAYNFSWSQQLQRRIRSELRCDAKQPPSATKVEMFSLMTAFTVGSLMSAIVNGFAAIIFEGAGSPATLPLPAIPLIVLAGGLMLDMLGTIGNRLAILKTNHLAITALNGNAVPHGAAALPSQAPRRGSP